MDLQLKGKKAIITGASRGVGRAIALGLAAEGADVALGATRPEGIEAVAKEAQAMGIAAYPIPVNLGNSEDTLAFMEKAEAALGGMDILINNA
ncbi:MAG: SDR family NAD(P)-dependent oxidoreductase, partial [Eubacterium aggregans]